MSRFGMPVIRLEVEGLKASITAAISEQMVQMDEMIRDALDAACSENALTLLVRKEVAANLASVVTEEVRRYFYHSNSGRQIIREALHARLDEVLESIAGEEVAK